MKNKLVNVRKCAQIRKFESPGRMLSLGNVFHLLHNALICCKRRQFATGFTEDQIVLYDQGERLLCTSDEVLSELAVNWLHMSSSPR
jgi:hypothetical protein